MANTKHIIQDISLRKGFFAAMAKSILEQYHETDALDFLLCVKNQHEDNPRVGNNIWGNKIYAKICTQLSDQLIVNSSLQTK